MEWSLVIHGGCGAMRPERLPADQEERARTGLKAALNAGSTILNAGGRAIDAVEAAARVLEEDPAFNAGRGSVLSADGRVELDAAIMDGRDRRAGAVAGLTTTRAPISLARAAMERTPHVLLTHEGADAFARSIGLEQVANDWFVIPERRRQLEQILTRGGEFDTAVKFGTIGAVACDRAGPCRRRHLNRRADRQALGPDRRFAADRRGDLCRRPRRGGLGDRARRGVHPRGRGA